LPRGKNSDAANYGGPKKKNDRIRGFLNWKKFGDNHNQCFWPKKKRIKPWGSTKTKTGTQNAWACLKKEKYWRRPWLALQENVRNQRKGGAYFELIRPTKTQMWIVHCQEGHAGRSLTDMRRGGYNGFQALRLREESSTSRYEPKTLQTNRIATPGRLRWGSFC